MLLRVLIWSIQIIHITLRNFYHAPLAVATALDTLWNLEAVSNPSNILPNLRIAVKLEPEPTGRR